MPSFPGDSMDGLPAWDPRRAWVNAFRAGIQNTREHIDIFEDTLAFVERYGLLYQGSRYDLTASGYEHLEPLYRDPHPQICLMAGAQTGKTAWMLARVARSTLAVPGTQTGVYYPTMDLAQDVSKNRFAPMILSSAALRKALKSINPATKAQRTVDGVQARQLGTGIVRFLWFGRTTTESYTLRCLFFDEVRRMSEKWLQLAEERQSAMLDYERYWISTAGMPDTSIDKIFRRSNQSYFHSFCGCAEGCVLSLTYPNCMADLRNATPALVRKVQHAYRHAGQPYLGLEGIKQQEFADYHAAFICPKCGGFMVNPREGWWEAHAPDKYVHGYQLPQMLSPSYPPPRVLEKMERSPDLGEIFRSMVGRPFTDASEIPVTETDLRAAVRSDLRWTCPRGDEGPEVRDRSVARVAGIDVQRGYLVGVIKRCLGQGVMQTEHLFVMHPGHPLAQQYDGNIEKGLVVLLARWGVRVAVIDAGPEWQTVRAIQDALPGIVYLGMEGGHGGARGTERMLRWSDDPSRDPAAQSAPGNEAVVVQINRTRALRWSAERWRRRENLVPPPEGLVVELPVTVRDGVQEVLFSAELRQGQWQPVRLADTYLLHQRSVAFPRRFRNEQAELTGAYTITAEHVGRDPHFAHAEMFAVVAATKIDDKLHRIANVGSDAAEPALTAGMGDEG